MFIEIIPKAYDFEGRKTFKPNKKGRRWFHPNFPFGRYLTQPISDEFTDIEEIRRFLVQCEYVSDMDQFGKADYWMPPEDFERERKGDCEDFAMWTWRQLFQIGYRTRFVVGSSGRYGDGHAWVTCMKDGKQYIVEPLACRIEARIPRWVCRSYRPRVSAEWDGKQIRYFEHSTPEFNPSLVEGLPLLAEALWFRVWLILRSVASLFGAPSPFVKVRKIDR